MKKQDRLSVISQLPLELNRDEMTTFLHQLPQLPKPVPAPSIWTAWRGWLIIGICSTGLLFTISRVLPVDSSPLVNVDTQMKSSEVKTISTPPIEPTIKDELVENTPSTVPVNLPETPEETLSAVAITLEQDSLFLPSVQEELLKSRQGGAVDRTVVRPPLFRYPEQQNLVVPIDTGRASGLFGDYTPNPHPNRFDGVPMKRLRRQLRRELLRDGLITSKKDKADLWLPEGAAFLNGEEMMPDLSLKYKEIARSFGIGTGPYRYIKTTDKGIALGDFREEGFFGKAWGVFKLDMPE